MTAIKFKTLEELRTLLRGLPTREVELLHDQYEGCQSRGVNDEIILSIIDNEMERRILSWEVDPR